MKGWFAIGVYRPKTIENLGTLWRSARNFGAAYIFTIGHRYKKQASDTTHTWQSTPLFQYPDFGTFLASRPTDCPIIGVEQSETSCALDGFTHLPRSIYLLGAEDNGLPPTIQEKCQAIVHISTPMCLNVAVAGSIVMYARSVNLPIQPITCADDKIRRLEHRMNGLNAKFYKRATIPTQGKENADG